LTTRTIIKPRRDTTANWVANNPILKDGEIAIEKVSDSNLVKIKIGDGTTAWNDLPVAADFPSIAAAETACVNSATAAATSETAAAASAAEAKTAAQIATGRKVWLAYDEADGGLNILVEQ
jgi:hypothetical protein